MRFTFPRICGLIALLTAVAAPVWAADPVSYKVDHFSAGDGSMDSHAARYLGSRHTAQLGAGEPLRVDRAGAL